MADDADEWERLFAVKDHVRHPNFTSLLLISSQAAQLSAVIAWWLHVLVTVEIKPWEPEKIKEHIVQLMSYLRQILREQMDRRFVPGLLLCRREMTVWIADRSGVLGGKTSFDIHKVSVSAYGILCGL